MTRNFLSYPQAKKQKFVHKKFGDKISDFYHWLTKRDSAEVMNYIQRENEYAKIKLKPLGKLKNKLFREMKNRLPAKYNQEPVSMGPYLYYRTWEKKNQYPIHKRRSKTNNKEEVILNENSIKTNSSFFNASNGQVSPNHQTLAYALDTKGKEIYNIYFKNLKTGKLLKPFIPEATNNFVWANNSETVFFVKSDKTLRPFKVYRFCTRTGKKRLVFHEKDVKFEISLNKTLSRDWITIMTESSQTTECHYLSADKPEKPFRLFCKRKGRHRYNINYGEGSFYILTNKDKAFNFKLMKIDRRKTSQKSEQQTSSKSAFPHTLWKELIPHRPDVFIENYEVFKDFIALETRFNGRQKIEVFDKKKLRLKRIPFKENVCSISLGHNREYETSFLRLEYQSLNQPMMVYDYEIQKKILHLKSQIPVKGGFSPSDYICKAEYVLARDGEKIPVSLVYKRGTPLKFTTPLLFYGYGAYGASIDPVFQSSVISLLDHGFIYAIAHIRGGGERGWRWYEKGKLLNKKNTFLDFICCAEHLINKSYTSKAHLYIMGVSAGGLLIGAVLNKRPDLFRGAIALVPFVDCLTTMLNKNIPLSTLEYEEWGNPNKKRYYKYIKSYCPYNNVKKTRYPNLFIQSGLHDSRVQYWEPLKWTAKLRDHKTDENLLLHIINMESGHLGPSGRLSYLQELSLYYAFLIGLEKNLIK